MPAPSHLCRWKWQQYIRCTPWSLLLSLECKCSIRPDIRWLVCQYKSPAAKTVDVADDRAFPLGSYSKEGEQKGGGEARSGSFDQNPKCTPSKLHCAFDVDEDAPLNIFLAKETLLLACGIYGVGSSRRKNKNKKKKKKKRRRRG